MSLESIKPLYSKPIPPKKAKSNVHINNEADILQKFIIKGDQNQFLITNKYSKILKIPTNSLLINNVK